jgi:type IV pilus assembly protein PilA
MFSRKYKKSVNGFTLIELMIAVTILSILVTIALTAYQDYTIRAQVTEGFSITDNVRVSVNDYYAQNGSLPSNLTTIGLLPMAGKYVSTVSMSNGVISIYYGGPLAAAQIPNTAILVMTPVIAATGNIYWQCTNGGTMPIKYLPTACS